MRKKKVCNECAVLRGELDRVNVNVVHMEMQLSRLREQLIAAEAAQRQTRDAALLRAAQDVIKELSPIHVQIGTRISQLSRLIDATRI